MAERLTDKQALAQMSSATRALIKRKGFVRCALQPNAWHPAEPTTPDDCGNTVHYKVCRCRSRRAN